MMKISAMETGQMMKLAGSTIRTLSEERDALKQKVASYEKKERAERIATKMGEKGLEPELDYQEKVAGLLQRDDLDVVETAVGLSAPQMKLASVHDDRRAELMGNDTSDGQNDAERVFAENLASL